MTLRRLLLGAVTTLVALLLQEAVLSRLPLPGGPPDLLLVLVVAFALVEGPESGTVTGFVVGLLADLGDDVELGRSALAYALVGYLAGLAADDPHSGVRSRSRLRPYLLVAACAVVAVTVFAGEGILLGDPRITGPAFARSLASGVTYCVLLTPFVVPLVGHLVRRLDLDPLRR